MCAHWLLKASEKLCGHPHFTGENSKAAELNLNPGSVLPGPMQDQNLPQDQEVGSGWV